MTGLGVLYFLFGCIAFFQACVIIGGIRVVREAEAAAADRAYAEDVWAWHAIIGKRRTAVTV